MLLYSHPYNRAREARGEALISSLWLWGGGRAQPLKKAFEIVGGDSELTEVFARVAGASHTEQFSTLLGGTYENGLWVCDAVGFAMHCGDQQLWRESVQGFEQEVAQPLLKALQAGRLHRLTLEVLMESGSQCFELSRADAWKFWRSEHSLARYAV
jgi:hypothetical protein